MLKELIQRTFWVVTFLLVAACAAPTPRPTLPPGAPQGVSTPLPAALPTPLPTQSVAALPTPLPCLGGLGSPPAPANRFGEPPPPLPTYPTGDITGSIAVSGQPRSYLAHVPQAINCSEQAMPLLIALHGAGGSGRDFMQLTQFNAPADSFGFVVAYPDSSGSPRSWNAGGASNNNSADVTFVQAVIESLFVSYPLNTKRVYLVGYDSGGLLAYRVATEMPGRITALATVAAMWDESLKPPAAPVSLFTLTGDADPLTPRARLAAAAWATAAGCAPVPQRLDGPKHTEDTYIGCRANATITALTLKGAAHAWPPVVPTRPDGATNSATALALWQFLAAQSR